MLTTHLSETLVCIQCGHKIIGTGLRAGRECPGCRCPMYIDGGDGPDFRINRGAQVIPDAIRRLRDQQATAKAERLYRAAAICALLSGLCIVPAILWGLSHL